MTKSTVHTLYFPSLTNTSLTQSEQKCQASPSQIYFRTIIIQVFVLFPLLAVCVCISYVVWMFCDPVSYRYNKTFQFFFYMAFHLFDTLG